MRRRLLGNVETRRADCARERFSIRRERSVPSEFVAKLKVPGGGSKECTSPALPSVRSRNPGESNRPHREIDLWTGRAGLVLFPGIPPHARPPLDTEIGPRSVRFPSNELVDSTVVRGVAGSIAHTGEVIDIAFGDAAHLLREKTLDLR